MILTDTQILKEIENGNIVIDPFNPENLGTNSYDVHLGDMFAVYEQYELDAKKHNPIREIKIGKEGFYCNLELYILELPMNILKPTIQFLSLKEKAV